MLNLPLRHLALSVEHAKSQLVYQDRRSKNLDSSKVLEVINNPDKFEVEDLELVGQTDDGADIYRTTWRTKPNGDNVVIDWDIAPDEDDRLWTYNDLVAFFDDNFRLVVAATPTGWTITKYVYYYYY